MPVIPGVVETYDKLKELHRLKNDDYSGDNGPFYNFEFCDYVSSLFKNSRDKVYAVFVAVKLARLSVVLTKQAKNEAVEDSFDDMINFACIWKADYLSRIKPQIRKIVEDTTVRESRG